MSAAAPRDGTPTDDPRPRLLLVEDDPDAGAVIRHVLDEAYTVSLTGSVATASEEARTRAFDVLVVDRRLPDGDGIDLVEELRTAGVATPTLVLSALGTLEDRVRGLDAGADDYLVKPFEFEELLARLRAIRRAPSGVGSFLRIGLWEFYPKSRAVYSPYDGRTILTERENDLLHLLAASPRRTFSRETILSSVFAEGDRPGTVDTYVHYVRRKTDPEIITTVRGRGYRLGQL